jgi:hypothetical protein
MTLDEATDQLYGAPLEEFVAERSRLARELREADQRDEAQELAKARKPTVAAWTLNQLARRNRRDVDLLLDAGHRLREAQAGVLRGGKREAFEQARQSENDALRRLGRAAETLLRETRGDASGSVLSQVGATLRAAAVSEHGRDLLARGRFSEPLSGEGFDLVAGLGGGQAPATKPATARESKQKAEREAKGAVREARSALREKEKATKVADREVERLRSALERAERDAAKAREQTSAAAREVEEAERAVERVRR